MSDRNITDLSITMQSKFWLWAGRMKVANIDYIVTCTLRTTAEQVNLYNQGRTTPGPIVTWTLNSKHLTGDAFDFVIMFCGKPDWKMVHMDQWSKAIEIGKSLGLTQVVDKNGQIKEFAHLQEDV